MADATEVFLDLTTPQGALVKSLDDRTLFSLGPFYQGQAIPLRVYPVVATGRTLAPNLFSKVALDNLSFELVYGPRAGATAILAAQYVWTKQTVPDSEGKSGYFYGTLDLNTTELNTAIGVEDQINKFLEFRLKRGADSMAPVCQVPVITLASVKDPNSSASIPTPQNAYLTAAQCYEMFVMWNNQLRAANAGRIPIFVSEDSAHTREAPGVSNAGLPIDNLN